MTETAALADIVLPATTFLEHDDIYHAGGHSHVQLGRRLRDTPRRMPLQPRRHLRPRPPASAREHPGFQMSATELADATLRASGYEGADADVIAGPLGGPPTAASARAHFLDGFAAS